MPAIDNRMGVAAAAMFGAAWRALITAHEERDSGERTMGGGLTWSKPGAKFVVSGSPSAATDRSIAGHIAMTHAYSLPQRSLGQSTICVRTPEREALQGEGLNPVCQLHGRRRIRSLQCDVLRSDPAQMLKARQPSLPLKL